MHIFEMIAIIAVVAILAGVVSEWIKKKGTPKVDLSDIESRLDKLEALEERVKVLEAIVTDQKYNLNAEIDKL